MKTKITFLMSALLLCTMLGWGQVNNFRSDAGNVPVTGGSTVIKSDNGAVLLADHLPIEGSQLEWTLTSGGVLTISGTGDMPDDVFPWDGIRPTIKSVVIEDGVSSIGRRAFLNCTELTSATIPASVQSIGESAFQDCSRLTSVTIPANVQSIGRGAFYNCSSLASITIPEGVTSIGQSAFSYCQSLTSMTIPANVTSIGEGVFGYCENLLSIDVAPLNTHYASDGIALYDKDQTILLAYPAGNPDATYTIPDGVSTIGMNAFSKCVNLTEVIIPADVTSIGS